MSAMQAIADAAVSDVLNKAPAGIALGLIQAMKGGAHNTYLWPERMAEVAAFIARGALAESGPPDALFLDKSATASWSDFAWPLLHLAGIDLPTADRQPTANDFVARD